MKISNKAHSQPKKYEVYHQQPYQAYRALP